MKLAAYQAPAIASSWGVVHDNQIVDGPAALAGTAFAGVADIRSLIELGPEALTALAASIHEDTAGHDLSTVRLGPPVIPQRDVFAIGVNYADHAAEAQRARAVSDLPSVPVVFSKARTSITGPFDPIRWNPELTAQPDYEVELGVVIGTGGRAISHDDALDHVFGYTVINDVSARDVQHDRPAGQWFLGKSIDTFCPLGPVIVTRDEIPDPQALSLRLRVNGEVRQESSTRNQIFGVAALVSEISRYINLLPGDVIATGTPAGVGAAMAPPVFLQDGDIIEAEIDGIGVIRNVVTQVTT